MNRQVRRAEEKKERKQEKDKAKAKAARRERRRARVAERRRSQAAGRGEGGKDGSVEEGTASGGTDGGGGTKPRRRGADPGRFSGALLTATVFFVVLQAVTPNDGTLAGQAVAASFYLLFGYFAVLWMLRRGTPKPVPYALAVGGVLWLGTAASQWLQPGLDLAPLMLALIPPLLVAGAFLGRLVYLNAPG